MVIFFYNNDLNFFYVIFQESSLSVMNSRVLEHDQHLFVECDLISVSINHCLTCNVCVVLQEDRPHWGVVDVVYDIYVFLSQVVPDWETSFYCDLSLCHTIIESFDRHRLIFFFNSDITECFLEDFFIFDEQSLPIYVSLRLNVCHAVVYLINVVIFHNWHCIRFCSNSCFWRIDSLESPKSHHCQPVCCSQSHHN